ncbi:phenylalanyl-tRNA synthetase beta chain [Marchantia polymorpha subsp. ruderalis]|uniref:phenylalanine--tRNA ligase n=1 Tax=Marchantia polymorpha TaxID=3197 RepID=A0A2R6XI33_MARPO|nr:hypothetical protein MARPO_0013s0023 [Marchantia polymorpha]BBN19081.1 hypothetical protein Mp_8g07720 [Marchantia polymorpha subsp. ruderalis]|eukprot:PTQ45765.1 hypothetical protein MARPO_0013s0023 [Marchantia polymorpha]
MPTVSVGRDLLFAALEQSFTDEEFDELCFDFGIELDEVTTEGKIIRKEKHLEEDAATEGDEEWIYKIEVPANRYDLLCLEGLARGLRVFTGKEEVPTYSLADMSSRAMLKMTVKPETSLIRPFVVCAVLRGITFTQARYNSFIDLQDKLHQNLCRKRTLVAIGTHDLDTLEGPFTYEALPPSEIKFVPLKQTKEFSAQELMEFYKSDMKLKKFLHIIESSPVYPVIYDSKRRVLSLPPIINGAHSAITLKTKNVFIECTATDLTKAKIVLNTMVTMFSQYCDQKFEVEPVEVITDGKSNVYPDLSCRTFEVDVSYINETIGVQLKPMEIVGYLYKMQLPAKVIKSGDTTKIRVTAPPTRSDVLHPCDVMEDVAIAFGFNRIEKTVPKSHTQGKEQTLNHFSDLLREQIALAGFTEVLTWILGSNMENFTMVNREDDKKKSVQIGNPRTSDFEVVRTSLLPGMLKTLAHNKKTPRPVKLFEVSDVVLLDSSKDVGAGNRRRLAALYCDQTSGFEVIHGLVDRVMEIVGISRCPVGQTTGYYIKPSQEPEYFTGRQANIFYQGFSIGTFGIVHPEVLQRFDIPDPCSAMELEIEPFL